MEKIICTILLMANTFFILGCTSSRKDSAKKYYSDFDYFKFSGINEKSDIYPYIEFGFDSINQIANINYNLSSSHTFRQKIKRLNSLIYIENSIRDVDETMYYYTLFFENKVIYYQYWGSPFEDKKSRLNLITISEKKDNGIIEETQYSFNNDDSIYLTLTVDSGKMPLEKAIDVSKNIIYIKDGKLYIDSDIKNGVSSMTECFELSGLSYSWYRIFGYMMKKCPGKNVPKPGDW